MHALADRELLSAFARLPCANAEGGVPLQGTPLGVPVQHRSLVHMALMRARKAELAQLRGAPAADGDFSMLCWAWDQAFGLRHGDCAARSQAGSDSTSHHPNQWTLEGLCRQGWAQVGLRSAAMHGRQGVGETRRGMAALATVAVAADTTMRAACRQALQALRGAGRSLVIAKHHDATPLQLHFGRLEDLLRPHALYAGTDQETGEWKLVSFLEHCRRNGGKPRSTKGVVEFFAQAWFLHWDTEHGCHEQPLHVMPTVLQRGNASTIYNATEGPNAAIPLNTVRELAKDLTYVLVCEIPDSLSANMRKKLKTMNEYELVPNVFCFEKGCDVHIVTSVMRNANHESDVCGHVHSIAYVTTVTHHHNAMLAKFREMVNSELLWYEGLEPLESWRASSKAGVRESHKEVGGK